MTGFAISARLTPDAIFREYNSAVLRRGLTITVQLTPGDTDGSHSAEERNHFHPVFAMRSALEVISRALAAAGRMQLHAPRDYWYAGINIQTSLPQGLILKHMLVKRNL